MAERERREKPPEAWTIYVCPVCGWVDGGAFYCEGGLDVAYPQHDEAESNAIEVAPRSLSGLASILQGLDETQRNELVERVALAIRRDGWTVDGVPDDEDYDLARAALSELGGQP